MSDDTAAPLRTVRLRGAPFIAARAGEAELNVHGFLEQHDCALTDIAFTVSAHMANLAGAPMEAHDAEGNRSPFIHLASLWIHRVARVAHLRPGYLLTAMQDEQGLLDVKRPAPLGAASPSIEAVDAIPEVWPEGVHFYRHTPEHGRVEILRVTGDRRMFSCMGYGIPDRHAVQDHNIRPWLGFAEQVMYAALRTRHLLDLWAAGQRKVTLYGNVEVTCADPESYVLATYTPSVVVDGEDPKATAPFGDVLTERPATAAHWGLS